MAGKQQAGAAVDRGSLLRRGSHSKKALKEKIVQIYEAFFRVSCSFLGVEIVVYLVDLIKTALVLVTC